MREIISCVPSYFISKIDVEKSYFEIKYRLWGFIKVKRQCHVLFKWPILFLWNIIGDDKEERKYVERFISDKDVG